MTPRPDLLAKYPTFEDRATFWRLPTLYKSVQAARDYSKDFPLIMTSGRDDLIQMEVLHGASDDGFTLRFIKVGKVGDARGMLLSKAFWTEDV